MHKIDKFCDPRRTDHPPPRPAPRPANSRLEKRDLRVAGLEPMPHWRDALKGYIEGVLL